MYNFFWRIGLGVVIGVGPGAVLNCIDGRIMRGVQLISSKHRHEVEGDEGLF